MTRTPKATSVFPDLPDSTRRALLLGMAAAGLTACGQSYNHLPKADHVYILKSQRRMYLIRERLPVKEFAIDLGFEPLGHKQQEGDGRTPEGLYWIDRKNPRSSFHLSLGINYPNAEDVARAEAAGVKPGGDIFIHGQPNGKRDAQDPDWTAGCIAVKNREIEEIYARVPVGTPVTILA